MGKKNKLSTQLMSVILLIALPLSSVLAGEDPRPFWGSGSGLGQHMGPLGGDEEDRPRYKLFNFLEGSSRFNPDTISPKICFGCNNLAMQASGQTAGVNVVADIVSKRHCSYPDHLIDVFPTLSSTRASTDGGYPTSGDLDYCSCVAELRDNNNERQSDYSDISAKVAGNLCRQAGNSQIREKVKAQLETTRRFGVLQTFARAALGADSTNACDGDEAQRIFKTFLPAQGNDGKRICSSQSVAYILNQLEKDAGVIDSDRENRFEAMLNGAKSLVVSEDGTMSEAQKSAQANFDYYVTASNTFFDSKKQEFRSELAAWAKEIYPNVDTESLSPDQVRSLIASNPLSKIDLAKSISRLVLENSTLASNDPFGSVQDELFGIEVVGNVDVMKMVTGDVEMTEEVATKLLQKFSNVSSNKCRHASQNVETQCKMVTSGQMFKPQQLSNNRCLLENKPELGEFISNPVNAYVNVVKDNVIYRAISGQFMCYSILRHGTVMTDFAPDNGRACDNNGSGKSVKSSGVKNLAPELQIRGGVESLFLGPEHEEVLAELSDCSPFKGGVLSDEYSPLVLEDGNLEEYLENVLNQRSNSLMEDIRKSVLDAERNGSDPSVAASNAVNTGRRITRASSGSSLGDDHSGSRDSSRRSDARSSISSKAASDASRSMSSSDTSSDFYRSMADRQAEFTSYVSAINSLDSLGDEEEVITSENAQGVIKETNEDIEKIDQYLAEIERLRNENRSLIEQMNNEEKDAIEASDGSTITRDSLREYDEKLRERKEKLLAEKEQLDSRIETAENALFNGASSNSAVASSARVRTAPNAAATPSDSRNNIGDSSRFSSSISSGSSLAGSGGGGSSATGAANSSANSFYGPAPYQGIVLTSEELSIAKPQLDLGGRSLNDSIDIVRAAIEAVKGEVRLPVQYVNGKPVLDYILQEQDGKTVMVYLDGEQVVVADVNLEVDSAQDEVVVEATPEAAEEAPAEPELRAPAQSGRKAWADVEAILDGAQ